MNQWPVATSEIEALNVGFVGATSQTSTPRIAADDRFGVDFSVSRFRRGKGRDQLSLQSLELLAFRAYGVAADGVSHMHWLLPTKSTATVLLAAMLPAFGILSNRWGREG